MKHLFTIIILLIFSACNMESPKNTEILEQNPEEIIAIKNVLITQQKCWNNGDIDGFMEGYWNSEELIFTSLSHEPAFGWENTLERYKNSYPTKESMGKLKFEFLDLKLISKNTASLKGKWELIRESDNPNGLFWLDLQKFDKKWLITKDSTISFEINIPLSLLECDKNNPS
jgi:hypothetical protein